MTYKDKGSYESSPPCNVSIIRNNMTWFNPSFLRIRTVCLLVHAYTHEGESVLRSYDHQCVLQWTHCNTLQHTATHCNTLQHIAAHVRMIMNEGEYVNGIVTSIPIVALW